LRKSHYDYATELFFGFVGGGLAVSVFERQHKLDASVAHVAALLSTVQIFSHSSAETASAQCPSRSGVIAASRKIIGFSEQSKLIVNFFRKRCAWGLT
jgi:hypothetical protein